MAFDMSTVAPAVRPASARTAALLWAIAREEAAGRRPPRLTEPGLSTWKRFRGRLSLADLAAILLEDAAVLYPIPFDADSVGAPRPRGEIQDDLLEQWLSSLVGGAELNLAQADYIAEQARLLETPSRMARSDLHLVKSHQKVLELPGTGGQLAHQIVGTQRGLTLQDNLTIACATWQECTLAGLVALDCVAPHTDFIMRTTAEDLRDPAHPLRQKAFDFVVGLHPDKGGLFRIEDQLAIWFPTAKVLLV